MKDLKALQVATSASKAETVHMCCRVQIFTAMRAVLSVCSTLFGKPMVYGYRRALSVIYGHHSLEARRAAAMHAHKLLTSLVIVCYFGTKPDMPDNSGAASLHWIQDA